jgi:hypothetical protein
MRVALLLTLLVGALLLTAAWRRQSNSAVQGFVPGQEPKADDGWSHLILGEPSGAPALVVDPPPAARTPIPRNGTPQPPPIVPLPHAEAIGFTYVVQPGDTLSQICGRFYEDRMGLSLTDLSHRVAEHNGLSSVNAIRAGDSLVLPPLTGDRTP